MNLKTLLTAGIISFAALQPSLAQSINKHKNNIHHTFTLHNGREKDAEQLYRSQQRLGVIVSNRLRVSDSVSIGNVPTYNYGSYAFELDSNNTDNNSHSTSILVKYDDEYIASINITFNSQGECNIITKASSWIKEDQVSSVQKILSKLGLRNYEGPNAKGLHNIIQAMEFFKEQTKILETHHEALSGGSK